MHARHSGPLARRDFLNAGGAVALVSSIFTGNLRGASDRIAVAFIGLGRRGFGNLQHALKTPPLQVADLCDVSVRPNHLYAERAWCFS